MASVLYEVKNTYGDQTVYLLGTPERGEVARHVHPKEMYVSPFVDMDQTYRFVINPPAETLGLRIRQGGADGDVLISTLNGDRKPLTDAMLARAFAVYPLMTLKVFAGIHFEALRLYLKGITFNSYPGTVRGARSLSGQERLSEQD